MERKVSQDRGSERGEGELQACQGLHLPPGVGSRLGCCLEDIKLKIFVWTRNDPTWIISGWLDLISVVTRGFCKILFFTKTGVRAEFKVLSSLMRLSGS